MRFKPTIISHHMLMGLKEGQEKMSKSDPDSAIFMEDAAEDVRRKIKKAYCPPQVLSSFVFHRFIRCIFVSTARCI
jgi:tyrosyl-tRNA synthetase